MAVTPIGGWRVVFIPETGIDMESTTLLGDGLGREEAHKIAFEYHEKQWEDDRPSDYQAVWTDGITSLFEFFKGHTDLVMIRVEYGVLAVFN